MENKLQEQYTTDNNLLIAQYLWQPDYQILLINLPNEFIKLNVDTDTMIKNVKLTKLKIKVATAFLKYTNFKDGLIIYV